MKKVLCFALVILLLLVLGLPAKLFLIGEPVDGSQLIYSVTGENPSLVLNVCTSDSAMALHGWKYRQDGDALYISARKVLVSPLFPSGIYQTTIDTTLLAEIYLGGKLIWEAQ